MENAIGQETGDLGNEQVVNRGCKQGWGRRRERPRGERVRHERCRGSAGGGGDGEMRRLDEGMRGTKQREQKMRGGRVKKREEEKRREERRERQASKVDDGKSVNLVS